MMRHLSGLLGALALLSAPMGAVAQAPLPDPLVREGAARKVSDHVHLIPDFSIPMVPNVGIVVGSKATLVIDTGLGPRNGAVVAAEVAKVSRGRVYLVITHFHPEHDLGAQAFPATVTLIRSKDQVADIAEHGDTMIAGFAQRSPAAAELLKGARFRPADVVFETSHDLDLGGVTVRLTAMGGNHTRGDTIVWVEPDGVLFAGDLAMTIQPALISPESSLARWLVSLDRLDDLKPKLIVPSHGPTGGVEMIAGYRSYLTTIRDRAGALKREGRTQAETVAAVTAEMKGRFPDERRLAGAIQVAYREAR